ncbi:hypothetical protein O0L34_g11976 [Tuta absoluta]|nr:hypothetical protein O0L34_g11976 [Tuta absoluta]
MVVESERQLLSDLGINNIEFVNLIENDKCDVGDKSKDDITNIDVDGTKGHYDNGTIEIDDESIQNDDETIQNDYETLDDEPVENYYDDAGINETQEEDDNFVLLIVGDEKVGTEKPVKHKMVSSDIKLI